MSHNAPEMTCGKLAAIMADLPPEMPVFAVVNPSELTEDIGLAPDRIPVRRVVTMESADRAISYARFDSWRPEIAHTIPTLEDRAT